MFHRTKLKKSSIKGTRFVIIGLLKNVPPELDKRPNDKEIQHIDDIIFFVALFAFCFSRDNIS